MNPPPTAPFMTEATRAETCAASPAGTTATFRATAPAPTSTKSTPVFDAATDWTVCTSTAPTANTRPQCCCTRLFANGVTDPTVSAAPTAARYVKIGRAHV